MLFKKKVNAAFQPRIARLNLLAVRTGQLQP